MGAEAHCPSPASWGRVESHDQFSSVAQSCPIPCDPMDCSTPGFPVHPSPTPRVEFKSLLKLVSIESVMPSNRLILGCPHLFLPSVFPSTRIFSSDSVLHIRWPNYWSFSFQYQSFQWIFRNAFLEACFPLRLTGLISLQSKDLSRVFSNTAVQKHQFIGSQLSS